MNGIGVNLKRGTYTMNKLVRNVAVAAGLAIISLPSFAAAPMGSVSNRYYVGVGFNHNAAVKEHFWINTDYPRVQLDDNDWGWNIFAGERKDHFAHELGINKIADVIYDEHSSDENDGAKRILELNDIYHFCYDGYLFKQITSHIELFAKIGLSYLEAKANFVASTGPGPEELDEYDSEIETFALNYGVGFQVNWKQFGFRGQYTHIEPAHDIDEFHFVTDFVSLDGLYYIG